MIIDPDKWTLLYAYSRAIVDSNTAMEMAQSDLEDMNNSTGSTQFTVYYCSDTEEMLEQETRSAFGSGTWLAYCHDGTCYKVMKAGVPSTLLELEKRTATIFTGAKKSMVKLNVKKSGGGIKMTIDASELHSVLDSIGVVHGANGLYQDRPPASYGVLDAARHKLSTEVLLKRGEQSFDLSSVYGTPPSMTNIRKLCESAESQVRAILEHYQPIDISVSIQKRVIDA